jgi:hypothetical protein
MSMPRPRWSLFALLAVVAGSSPAASQPAPDYGVVDSRMSSSLAPGRLSQSLIDETALRAGGVRRGKSAGVSTVTTGSSNTARDMAGGFPEDRRAGIERGFRELLAAFAKVEGALGVPAGDVAGAAALFVIGSYEAHRDTAVDQSVYGKVIAQMRVAIRSSPEFARATARERREAYERLAIIGMLLTATRLALASQPDEAVARNLRAAARTYLSQFLHADPDRIAISAAGVAIEGPVASAGAAGNRSPALAATAQIETVGMYTATEMGYGGMILQVPTPIVLFRSGDALLEMGNLNDPAGIEANKRSDPGSWTRWRRNGKKIERKDGQRWRELEWTPRHGRLPRGFKLDRTYQRFSGGGNTFAGGTTSIAVWRNLRFDRSGRFSSDGGSGSTTGGVTARSRAASEGGTYEIEGYTLTLRHDDGRIVHRSIVANPKDTKVIWIDGTGYTSD